MRDAFKDLPGAVRDRIKMDVETAGKIKIHRLDVKQDLDANARHNLGDKPFYLAIRGDAVLLSGGDECLEALKDALAAKPGKASPAGFELSLSRLVPAMTRTKTADPLEAAQKAFGGTAQDNDKVRFSIEGGKSLTLRVVLNTPVIKFFGIVNQGGQGK